MSYDKPTLDERSRQPSVLEVLKSTKLINWDRPASEFIDLAHAFDAAESAETDSDGEGAAATRKWWFMVHNKLAFMVGRRD